MAHVGHNVASTIRETWQLHFLVCTAIVHSIFCSFAKFAFVMPLLTRHYPTQEALAELKGAVRAAGEHKQRIAVTVAMDGIRLRDDRTGVGVVRQGNAL